MKEYTVTWEIQVQAANPTAAAEMALKIQRDYRSTATCFCVSDPDKNHTIDLGETSNEGRNHDQSGERTVSTTELVQGAEQSIVDTLLEAGREPDARSPYPAFPAGNPAV